MALKYASQGSGRVGSFHNDRKGRRNRAGRPQHALRGAEGQQVARDVQICRARGVTPVAGLVVPRAARVRVSGVPVDSPSSRGGDCAKKVLHFILATLAYKFSNVHITSSARVRLVSTAAIVAGIANGRGYAGVVLRLGV